MTYANPKPPQFSTQDTTALGLDELQHILDAIDASDLVDRLQAYRWTGRRGYPLEGMLRAYLTSYALNIGNTSELVRRLQDDPRLRLLCGIPTVPHRTTFSRFFSRLTNHQGLIRDAIAGLTTQMEQLLPDFGEAVAVDSSVVTAYANKRRQTDADASWTKKPNSDGEDEWYYGYKLHMAVDAAHGLPIAAHVTTASRSDSPELPAYWMRLPKLMGGSAPSTCWRIAGTTRPRTMPPPLVMALRPSFRSGSPLGVRSKRASTLWRASPHAWADR